MNITVIYSSGRKQNSCSSGAAKMLAGRLLNGGELFEFHLPRDMPHICMGCGVCLGGKPEKCGSYPYLKPILQAFARSDLLVFCSPVYVYHTPGQMKTLLDHFGYRWMVHRFDAEMMKKQAVVIATAGGGGLKSAVKDIRDSLDFWGVARTHVITQSVWEYNWSTLPDSFRRKLTRKVEKTAAAVENCAKRLTPSCKIRLMYRAFCFLHKNRKMNELDDRYWMEQGYTACVPWKK